MDKLLEDAQLYFDIGNKQKAYDIYKVLINENPNIPEAWYGIARCIDDIKHKEYCLERALQLRPNYEAALSLFKRCQTEKVRKDTSNPFRQEPLTQSAEDTTNPLKVTLRKPPTPSLSNIASSTVTSNNVTANLQKEESVDIVNVGSIKEKSSIKGKENLAQETTPENPTEKKFTKIAPIVIGILLFFFGILLVGRLITNRNTKIQNTQLYSDF